MNSFATREKDHVTRGRKSLPRAPPSMAQSSFSVQHCREDDEVVVMMMMMEMVMMMEAVVLSLPTLQCGVRHESRCA